MEYDPNTLCAQLWHRHDQIVSWHDVRFICLVHVEIGTSGSEEGGDDEIEFTIRKTIQIGKSETFSLQATRLTSRSRLEDRLTSFLNNTVTPLKKE